MNFGALNRSGGERRLNVAITRAKEEVVVFSSIHGDQIDLNRTSATGAAHLRHFLNYAEHGQTDSSVSYDQQCDGLPETIAQFLEAHGWQVHRNVGSSVFRIDVGVLDPKRPGEYLLGIECDGPVYASQRTVRDRDHIRISVLESLGWRIHRAWSLDWQFDRPHAESALLQALSLREQQ